MPVKIISVRSVICFFALTLLVAGCTPAGPRALLKGKKYLEAGDYAAAAAQLQVATSLLSTNAAAWNYYGVALQRTGQAVDAANAYNRALELDRELLEARLNLGMLYLEQNQAEPAKAQFTAYTLRRPNDPNGWLNLGSAQLKLGEIVSAERSFSAVLALKTSEAEAYNGLGLARIQRNRPQEAAQFFAAAVQAQPDFAPALLNLATVNQQYLRNPKAALENFQKYLALSPRPENWDEVNAIVESLQRAPVSEPVATTAVVPAPVAPVAAAPKPAPLVAEAKPVVKPTNTQVAVKPLLSPRAQSQTMPRPVATTPAPARPAAATPPQVVQVSPGPQIVATPTAAPKTAPKEPPLVVENESKPGLWQKLFGGSKSDNSAKSVTPLPDENAASANPPKPKPVILPPSLVHFPRYSYQSPARPAAGNRQAASAAFAKAQVAEQNNQRPQALAAYQQAAELDPAWFEAQYNAGVLAQRQGEYADALASYEKALAIQPDSVNARYNFALTLKAAGYSPDAAAELKKIIAAKPGEVRAHLTLGNLYAQALHDPAQARVHYLKVLELEPSNPNASDIRFWLAANP